MLLSFGEISQRFKERKQVRERLVRQIDLRRQRTSMTSDGSATRGAVREGEVRRQRSGESDGRR